MKNIFNGTFLFATIVLFSSCSKQTDGMASGSVTDSTAEILRFQISGKSPRVSLTSYSVDIRFDDSVMSGRDLVASFALSDGAAAYIDGVKQQSDVSINDFTNPLTYSVVNRHGFTKRWKVTATNNDYSSTWGLGSFVKSSLSNDRPYRWYFTQDGSGISSDLNCGPASTAMAMKWLDPNFTGTPLTIRNYYPQNYSDWGIHTIENYFEDFKVKNTELPLGNSAAETRDILRQELDKGNIWILLLSMSKVRQCSGPTPAARVDKYYPGDFNHFIVVYGYKEVDKEFYLQVNDPWGHQYLYSDGSLMASGRFYRYEDIFEACKAIDNTALVVYKK